MISSQSVLVLNAPPIFDTFQRSTFYFLLAYTRMNSCGRGPLRMHMHRVQNFVVHPFITPVSTDTSWYGQINAKLHLLLLGCSWLFNGAIYSRLWRQLEASFASSTWRPHTQSEADHVHVWPIGRWIKVHQAGRTQPVADRDVGVFSFKVRELGRAFPFLLWGPTDRGMLSYV